MTDKIATTSAQVFDENLNKLREIFPNFVKDGQVDFDALQAFLKKDGVLADGEKYGLNWAGKSDAFRAIRTPSTGTLTPQPEESKNWDETENIFIEGDNLEVLKLLQKHYTQKIKMIYIDPPYNTGKDFVYKDNFTQGVADYYERTGQTKGGIKMTTNTEKNGRYHSDWLTMMYPRLFLARNLLKDDGVIFVSIDDNEVANLRLIMDEVFGEENFVGEFVVIRAEGGGLAEQYVKGHDYLLVAAKNIANFEPLRREKEIRGKIIEKDGKQYYLADDWLRREFGKYGALPYEEIEQVRGIKKKQEIDEGIKKGIYQLIKKKEGYHIVGWLKPLEGEGSKFYSILKHLSSNGKEDLESVGLSKNFDFPKPVSLIKSLVLGATFSNKNASDIILDFFAGSGTTAHAVMDLNAKDGGNRKWICVQLPEAAEEDSDAYKAGYKKISDISRERIRRAGDKIKESIIQEKIPSRQGLIEVQGYSNEEIKEVESDAVGDLDIGFKSYTLSQSNYRQWQNLTAENNKEDLIKQSKLFIEKPLVDGFDEQSVVYEILIKEGFGLNSVIEQEKGDLKRWVVIDGDKKIMITFADKVSQDQVEKMKLSANDVFVCFDSALDDTAKVNLGRVINIKTI